ncbi:dihydrodipicolinate synthase family protein [Shinella curvata]|uniref:Dihydrodipicolinate synthase family protein n=1 Tax=Shinella curvata TaxID=1817964 RepID=A0ABT8XB67_9HYPH|nr:dihydrodipicolinate synthase family protein [Shinella curvata]MCJ8054636.1 dihydrodipicolinate synthase family protein [Shinella curvata]MDO6120969.1 dihydrodipicolinate synthase family protein [Shinella curvata]
MSLFKGLSAFPITPADASGRVDIDALGRLLLRIRDAEADSVGLLGSTGGYAFLTGEERLRAMDAAMNAVGGAIPVIVGVGAIRTSDAQTLAKAAKIAGADGLLLAPVSYAPLTEEEVYAHFAAVAEAGQLPLCIYNNPGTTKFVFTNSLIAKLSKVANIAAVKMPLPAQDDFEGELEYLRGHTPTTFRIGYSGDSGAAPSLLAGGDAWYSVVGGLLPVQALALTRAAQSGDRARTGEIDEAFQPLWALFRQFGSFRVMYTIADVLGLCKVDPPLPVLPIPETAREQVRVAITELQRRVPG